MEVQQLLFFGMDNDPSRCGFISSLSHPLKCYDSNQLNPCFISSISIIAAFLFGVTTTLQFIEFRFFNHYGPFKIKYAFGKVLGLKSVGIYQLMKIGIICLYGLNLALNATVFNKLNGGVESSLLKENKMFEIANVVDVIVLVFIIFPFQLVEPTRSVVSLASLSLYWLYRIIITGIVLLQDLASYGNEKGNGNGNDGSSALIITQDVFLFMCPLVIFVLETFFYRPSTELKQYYELNDWDVATVRNMWSEVTFIWLDPLIKKIYQTQAIEVDEIPKLHVEQQCPYTYDEVRRRWDLGNHSLFKIYCQIHGWKIVKIVVMDFISVACNLTQAFMLKQFITYMGQAQSEKRPVIIGLSIATAMFLCSVGKYTSGNQLAATHFKIRTQVYSALGTFVYRKGISLSGEARMHKNSGEIINNLAVDVLKLAQLAQFAPNLTFPIRIVITLVAIYHLLGVATLFGFITALILVPLSSKVSSSISRLAKKNMGIRDERIKLTSEILQSIKSVKLYAWEQPMLQRLFYIRNDKELKMAQKVGVFNSVSMFLWNTIPFAIAISCLIAFVKLTDLVLVPSIIFPALSLFDLLTDPIMTLPDAIVAAVEARVSFKRLNDFFLLPETDSQVEKLNTLIGTMSEVEVEVEGDGDITVYIKDATYNWTADQVALSNVNFKAKKGQLTSIVGKVGTGKSALLKALLGDVQQLHGTTCVSGRIAYCAQSPWIQNATVKENILFGCKLNQEYYARVVKACQLTMDFDILPDGDETVVGEKGISLSGGQKARVSLARAVYSQADVYLLDDVLSAVDAHVGQRIIREVLGSKGLLASKTTILATNAIKVLKYSNNIYLVKDKTVFEEGDFQTAQLKDLNITELIKDHVNDGGEEGEEEEEEETTVGGKGVELENERQESQGNHQKNNDASTSKGLQKIAKQNERKTAQKKEALAKGTVKLSVYLDFFKACNFPMIILYVVIYGGNVFCTIAANYILKYWSQQNLEQNKNVSIKFYLTLYAIAGISGAACMLTAALIMWCYCILNGARYFHDKMARAVLRSPMQFFETTPIGRILNRFSDDMNVVDQQLIWSILAVVDYGLLTVGLLSVVIFNLPIMGIVVFIFAFVFNAVRAYFISSARELKRLLSASRSPIFSHLLESVAGVETIKAFDQLKRFEDTNNKLTGNFIKVQFTMLCCARWLSMRLQTISAFIVYTSSLFILSTIGTKHQINPGMAGFILINALSITSGMNVIVRGWADIEAKSVSVERVIEYCNLTPEAPEIVAEYRPPAKSWPANGAVEFKNYYTKYRDNFDYVLKDINLNIKPGEKIGVVGRTGAGKSTLTMALFRIIEATNGGITIDSINTEKLGLFDLRSNLNIIPQDSSVVEGTLRENLDPLGKHADEELWRVLELAHLRTLVEQLVTKGKDGESEFKGLDAMVFEGGSNFSTGQRQLLSLARALLNTSKILVLDEATASIDVETDHVVQETIRTEFRDKTIITIAHRLETILDSDRVLVLDKGQVKEFASPKDLMSDKNSMFYSLCSQGGIKTG